MQVEDTICFHGILDCVHMSFNTHNATLVTQVTSVAEMWMLLVLQLQPNSIIDRSQFVEGCAGNMTYWKFWNYAECTVDISRINGYVNCSVSDSQASANPSPSLPAWVYVIIAVCISLAFVVVLVCCVLCCCERDKIRKW